MAAQEKKAVGRPMDDDLDGRIMEAAWHLLADKSLASLTIREIAECAGTSRPAIYRRWNSVEEVAIDAFLEQVGVAVLANAALSPPAALREYIGSLGRFIGGRVGRVIAEILGRAQSEPALMQRFHSGYLLPRRDNGRSIVLRGQKEGYFRADLDCDMIIDLYAGPIYFRAFAKHAPLDEDFTRALADLVLNTINPQPANKRR